MDKKYVQALQGLPTNIKAHLENVDESLQSKVTEICVRVNKPLAIVTFLGEYFFTKSGTMQKLIDDSLYIVSKKDIDDCIKQLTEYSIHSCQDKINQGFITISGGHRAGIVGTCCLENGNIVSVTDISTINLRIAREIKGIATTLTNKLYSDGICSTLIVGSPSSGKTTILRDMVRILASGKMQYHVKIAVVDERGEIAAVKNGIPQNDIGILSDVLDGYPKGIGMQIAVRSLSPTAIVIDEIGGADDVIAIAQSLNAGVKVIATVHADSLDELLRKKHIALLMQEGAFQKAVILSGAKTPCIVKEIINLQDNAIRAVM